MRPRPSIPLIVAGTLIALGIRYGVPALAQWTASSRAWREALTRVTAPIGRPLYGEGQVPLIAPADDVVPDDDAVPDEEALGPQGDGDGEFPGPPNDEALAEPARAAVEWARRQAAERLGVRAGDVALVSIRPVVWRDASLGCPASGGMYLQVLTPGYRIVLQVGEVVLEYHSAEGQPRATLCEGADSPSDTEPLGVYR